MSNLKRKNVALYDSSDEGDDGDGSVDDLDLPLQKLNLGHRKKLLVLCVGGFLVHRVHKCRRVEAGVQGHTPDAVRGNFLIFKRPFCQDFLEFCFQRFEVGIWSAALKRNIDAVLDIIMRGVRGKFVFVWGQENCTDTGFKTLSNKEKPFFLKEVKKLWENKDRTLPCHVGAYSASNTLLINTEPSKCLLNPPNTAIFPHEYKVHNVKDTFLGPEGELQAYLRGLADADDVPTYVKEHAVGQPALTPSHPDWNYYVQGTRRFRLDEDSKLLNKQNASEDKF